MSKKIYEVWIVKEVGHVFVEATTEDQARALAEEQTALNNFMEELDGDLYAGATNELDDNDIQYWIKEQELLIYKGSLK